jgi:beta-mannosidase
MPPTATRPTVVGREALPLDAGWQAAAATPDERTSPDRLDDLAWISATVPGTAAGARRAAGLPTGDPDAEDWWFRTSFEAAAAEPGEEVLLRFGGLATLAEVFLNGEPILSGESMFERHAVDVGTRLRGSNELAIRFRALAPQLATQRRPRARWRTRLVADNNLRWFRTALIGRIPGFAPGPAIVGPWRPIELERRSGAVLDDLAVRASLHGSDGVVAIRGLLRSLDGERRSGVDVEIEGPSGVIRSAVAGRVEDAGLRIDGEIRVPNVATWWPHTHGQPALYDVRVSAAGGSAEPLAATRVGFRALAAGPTAEHDIERDGLFVHVNGVPVFARGALWTPLDVVSLGASEEDLRVALEAVRAAGMNMVRLPGFGVYEQDRFHDLCDELGILVWQDLMFMSMDYPFTDETFGDRVAAEVRVLAGRLGGHPSTAVLCGNSEVEQQVAMLGLDLGLARIPFFDDVVPAAARGESLDAIYVPSVPWGGDLPMRPDRGVTGYYGVGGYRAPLSDARTSGIRFAGECLAFANVPTEEALAELVPVPPYEAFVHNPYWKAGVARDAGSGWDFDDLRDFYFEQVLGIDPGILRRGDHDRYLELSRAVTGEVMAQVFGEWRRTANPSGGGMILWLRDLVAGAGWGVVDHRGHPKTAYHHLRRILAPTAVWLVDEGIGGVVAHVANDGPDTLRGSLRIALYTDLELPVGRVEVPLSVPPHGAVEHDVEGALGRFVDAAWAYRFGPPAQDAIVATIERDGSGGREILSQAFHFPAGRPPVQEPEGRLGLAATATPTGAGGAVRLVVTTRRLAYGVRIHVAGFATSDDAFSVEPGGGRVIELTPRDEGVTFTGGSLTALNLLGRVAIRPEGARA